MSDIVYQYSCKDIFNKEMDTTTNATKDLSSAATEDDTKAPTKTAPKFNPKNVEKSTSPVGIIDDP